MPSSSDLHDAHARIERRVRVLEDDLDVACASGAQRVARASRVGPCRRTHTARPWDRRRLQRCPCRPSSCRSPTRPRAPASCPAGIASDTPSTAFTWPTTRLKHALADREVDLQVFDLQERRDRRLRRPAAAARQRRIRCSACLPAARLAPRPCSARREQMAARRLPAAGVVAAAAPSCRHTVPGEIAALARSGSR